MLPYSSTSRRRWLPEVVALRRRLSRPVELRPTGAAYNIRELPAFVHQTKLVSCSHQFPCFIAEDTAAIDEHVTTYNASGIDDRAILVGATFRLVLEEIGQD